MCALEGVEWWFSFSLLCLKDILMHFCLGMDWFFFSLPLFYLLDMSTGRFRKLLTFSFSQNQNFKFKCKFKLLGYINIINIGTNLLNHFNPFLEKEQNRLQDHSTQILLVRNKCRTYAKFLVYTKIYKIEVELLKKAENAKIPYLLYY